LTHLGGSSSLFSIYKNLKIKRWVVPLLLASLFAFHARASTVNVAVSGTGHAPAAVSARARRVDGEAAPIDLRLPVGEPGNVDLGEGTWEISTTAAGLWAAPVYVTATQAVTLQLWPRGSITGKLGGKAPASGDLVVNFVPSQPSEKQPGPAGMTVCAFVDRNWSCALPAGELDLRFSLTGFATEFRWAVKIGTDAAVPMGQLDFTPGSSISGKVQLRKGANPEILRTAEVSLSPVNADPAIGNVRQYASRPDARGFFQVKGSLRENTHFRHGRRTSSAIRAPSGSSRRPMPPSRILSSWRSRGGSWSASRRLSMKITNRGRWS
jgi:hypothetical protein